jgi:hypothetical protein
MREKSLRDIESRLSAEVGRPVRPGQIIGHIGRSALPRARSSISPTLNAFRSSRSVLIKTSIVYS